MLHKWVLKAIVQKIISFLPFKNRINYLFQKYITKGVQLTDDFFFDRLTHAKSHINSYIRFSNRPIDFTSLELGTGWYPIVPIACFLVGARKIYSLDISTLTNKSRILKTIEKFLEIHNKNLLCDFIQPNSDRLKVLTQVVENESNLSFEDILDKLHIVYLIEDARNISLNSSSIDLINSNNTFEHIYKADLINILKEFKRILVKETGVMSHFIDMSDHFAHFDSSINIYNFLKFSDFVWNLIDNKIQPQNRLRISDYKSIYRELGIPIVEETHRKGNIDELRKIKYSEKYFDVPELEMATSHSHLVSKIFDS